MRKTILRIYFVVFALLVTVLISGCVSSYLDDAAWLDTKLGTIWPAPPSKPRIKLLRVINGPSDIVVKSTGAVSRFLDFLVGSQQDYLDFYTPQCMAADGKGLIYIADPSIGLVHVYNLANNDVRYILQAGETRLVRPVGVALASDGSIYVTDSQLGAVFHMRSDGSVIKELDSGGRLESPAGIAINSIGDKIVADMHSQQIFIFDADDKVKKIIATNDVPGGFRRPMYVAVDTADSFYVTDTMNFKIRVFDKTGKYLRSLGQIGDTPGNFARPKGVAVDSDSHIYVVDSILANFQIFNQQDQLLLYVGQEGAYPGEMMLPSGIFIDKYDRIYLSDTFNHRIQVFQYLKEGRTP